MGGWGEWLGGWGECLSGRPGVGLVTKGLGWVY